MSAWTCSNFAAATRGTWIVSPGGASDTAIQPKPLAGVGIDTREPLRDCAFVAIAGERFDGHDFLDAAIDGGARMLVVSNATVDTRRVVQKGVCVLLVKDCVEALSEAARWWRRSWASTRMIAITGSAGKTTTKQFTHAALSTSLTGSAAPRSFNNHIGVPLTLLNARADDDYVVVEIGMNAPGEIAALAAIAQPDIAVITNIGKAHVGGVGSLEQVAAEKLSMLDHMAPDGIAIIADTCAHLVNHAQSRAVTTFGCHPGSDVRMISWHSVSALDGVEFETDDGAHFSAPIPGRHNALNALAAVCVARAMGCEDGAIHRGLAAAQPAAMRWDVQTDGGRIVVNDAYNANPDSMRAAIQTFFDTTGDVMQKAIVLGDMLELGSHADREHAQLGAWLVERARSFNCCMTVGPHMLQTHDRLTVAHDLTSRHFADASEKSLTTAASMLVDFDAILIKGSRTMRLERLVEMLRCSSAPIRA